MFAIPRFHLSKSAVLGLGALAAMAAVPPAHAQITSDAQIPFSFSSLTLMSPRGIAVAPNGTVYVADPRVGVVQITPTTGLVGGTSGGAALIVSTAVELNTTLTAPTAVAVDSNGNLYAADAADGKVIELPSPVTTSTPVTVTYTGTETPTALAVDPNNNLYIADENQEAIYKVVNGKATKLNITMPYNCFLFFCNQPPLQPLGLAADANGDVYFANDDNTVYEYNATTHSQNNTTSFLANPNAGNWEFSANAATYPIGMGFDPAGDLYVMDSGSGNLIEITPTTNYQLPLSSALTPASLAVSSIGNLYISDDTANTADEIYYNNNPFNFGPVPSNTNSPAVTVNFQFNTHGHDLATYQSIQGDLTTEFKTLSPTCSGNTSPCSMAFYVNYSSTLPGVQNGLVGLANTSSGAIYAVPNTGISLASALALYPGTQATLPDTETLYEPQGLAVTGNDQTLFIADEGEYVSGHTPDYEHGAVWEYKVTAGAPGGTPTKVGGTNPNFTMPDAVALNSAGDLYVADYSGTVTEIPATYSNGSISWAGKGTNLTFTGTAALNHPMSLTFDPSGNLYIGDMGPAGVIATASNPGYIVKVPANGGPAVRLNYKVNGVAVVFPQALVTDSQGNLYIADGGDADTDPGGVDVVPVATGTASAISFGSFGQLSQPSGLSFDAANDLYVLDGYNQRVLVVPITFAGTVPTVDSDGITLLGQGVNDLTVSGLTSALITPSDLVVWPGGQSITISDIGFKPATGPSNPVQVLTLQSVNATVGASSGSASVTGVNVGNEEITFAAPGSSGNSAFTLSGCGSTSGSTLATGITAGCTTTITYAASGTTSQSNIFTLNGDLTVDGSALGNQITVSGASEQPVGVWSGGGQQSSQFGDAVTLTNTGVLPLNISAVGFTNGSEGGVTDLTGTCTLLPSLTQNQSCTVTFSFTAANDNATINVTDNNGGGTNVVQSVAVTYGTNPDVQPALSLPAADVPRDLLDRGNSNTSNNRNVSNTPNTSTKKGKKKLHQ